MSNGDLTPFPSALMLDTSFLRTVGGTGSAAYQTFSEYVESEGITLFLGERVVEELTEQRSYISIDWIEKARTTDWVTIVGPVQPGVRVHDGPRAGVVMDRVHQRAKITPSRSNSYNTPDSANPSISAGVDMRTPIVVSCCCNRS